MARSTFRFWFSIIVIPTFLVLAILGYFAWRQSVPGVREGGAMLEVRARDGFWRPIRVDDKPVASVPVTLDFTPPSLEVVSATRYWAKGGGGLVVVRSRGASRVAVGVGALSFRAYPAGAADSNLYA